MTESERADVFRGLASEVRRDIVRMLVDEPATIYQLRTATDLKPEAFTRHLDVLRETGLVRTRPKGRTSVCTLNRGTLKKAARWLDRCL